LIGIVQVPNRTKQPGHFLLAEHAWQWLAFSQTQIAVGSLLYADENRLKGSAGFSKSPK